MNKTIKVNGKIIRYSVQLAMLNRLLNHDLISQIDYEKIRKQLMKDYKIVSNLTA